MAEHAPAEHRAPGAITMLFTDIEGSTALLQQIGVDKYEPLLADHHRLIRTSVAAHAGVEVKTEGDSFFVVFPRAIDAVTAAVEAQRSLAAHDWGSTEALRVRMGIHTGDVRRSDGDYVGLDVHRAARISAAAHGGQVLISDTTRALVANVLPADVDLRDLGEHRLKDLVEAEYLHQLVIEGLPTDFPPPRATTTRLDLLPAEASSFVGRKAELSTARELLANTRLLTLVGPGGTGKTRLALRLARSVAEDFADGIAFVAMAAITEPRLVLPTVRHELALQEQPGRTALETIKDRLAGRQVLLVLDNFEQIVAAAAALSELLQAVPRLKLVVTSRVALHVAGEQEYAVPPLSVPSSRDAASLARAGQSDAVTLFVQRARAVRAEFDLTEANAGYVVEICARLDGLPLAIELAASRIKLLPPRALLERLGKRLDLLQTTAADRTDRQRTLRGAIAWSYELLGESERTLFRRLAIFVGGFRFEDAEAVVAAPGPTGVDVFDGVATLVDNSLVREVGSYADVRFGMLETIREFGREQLDSNSELDAIAEAHARCFMALVEEAEPLLTAGSEWPDRLEADHDNIRAALAWLAEHDVQLSMGMAARLWRFWHLRGHLREGAAILTGLLGDARAPAPTPARARALVGLAGLVYWQTNYDLAQARYEEALTIAQQLGDSELEVEVLYSLAYVRAIEGDFEAAERDFRAAQELYEGHGNELMATWALEAVGMTATIAGDHERAVPLLEESLERFERLHDTFGLRNTLSVLARALMHLARLDEARALNRRVTDLAIEQHDVTSLSASLHDAASLAALKGDLERAAILTGAAQRIVEESGGQPPPALVNRIEALPELERQLDGARLGALIGQGRRLSADEAAAVARAI